MIKLPEVQSISWSITKKSTRLRVTLTAALTVGLLIGGCKNVPPVTSGVGTDQMAPGQKFEKHLQVDNPDLGKKLHISDIRSRKNNSLLELNLSLTSTYKKTQHLQYQFTWFDADGFVIEAGKSPWQPLELNGMQTASLPGLAPTPQVATFKIYVREVAEQYFKFAD
ncbi:YcfL family protein [Colwellia sp. E2M01]|uniref:YcfL family protein n=1 Tax=Colwellia sp. E2M01 TaxID=2841561 RepID=UPI001C09DC97|nr:YcfL family protein [Colwellia sp. E2M01]MBU2870823.1 YcfL family protein [Colwellia sp. E2M01]